MRHKHHIIPRYESGSNLQENLVELTTTQHAMWHYAEWTRKKDNRDYLAWKCLSGQIGKEEIQKIFNSTLDRLEEENDWFKMEISEEFIAEMDKQDKDTEGLYKQREEEENKWK